MTAFLIIAAIYITVPIIAILVSGRKISALGWLVFILLWPIGWIFWGNEELP